MPDFFSNEYSQYFATALRNAGHATSALGSALSRPVVTGIGASAATVATYAWIPVNQRWQEGPQFQRELESILTEYDKLAYYFEGGGALGHCRRRNDDLSGEFLDLKDRVSRLVEEFCGPLSSKEKILYGLQGLVLVGGMIGMTLSSFAEGKKEEKSPTEGISAAAVFSTFAVVGGFGQLAT